MCLKTCSMRAAGASSNLRSREASAWRCSETPLPEAPVEDLERNVAAVAHAEALRGSDAKATTPWQPPRAHDAERGERQTKADSSEPVVLGDLMQRSRGRQAGSAKVTQHAPTQMGRGMTDSRGHRACIARLGGRTQEGAKMARRLTRSSWEQAESRSLSSSRLRPALH